MTFNEAMTLYVAAFVDELARLEVKDVVISPGSRSTPMAVLMAEHPQINVWMQVDERSAGFFGLGIAKAKGQPAAVLCTSGTAAANLLPAIVEAYYARVPILILTADRPHELRDVGAPQAIDQVGLFGKHVKWFVDLALPEDTDIMLNYVRTAAGRAVAMAALAPAGPVHLNFPFREPLIPDLSIANLWDRGRPGGQCYVQISESKRQLEPIYIQRLAEDLQGTEKGLIVCGPNDCLQLPAELTRLAAALQYPILADPLSQLRSGSHSKEWVCDSYDAFLRNEKVKAELKPEVIIRFGAVPISKAFSIYLQANPQVRQIIIDSPGGWREPTLMASDMLYTDPVDFCRMLAKYIKNRAEPTRWSKQWRELNQVSQSYMQTKGRMDFLFEGQVIIELQNHLPDNATLFVGNSMPVRDVDTFFAVNDKNIYIMANRGANGIDGVISSALGAGVIRSPVVLVIGDLSFFHDLNGLLLTKLYDLNITIVVINNDGGGIFSFLPQANDAANFEMLFGTPTGLDYKHVVHMYGGSFSRISNWREFHEQIANCGLAQGLSVIEVPSNREENAKIHNKLWQSLSDVIDTMFENGD